MKSTGIHRTTIYPITLDRLREPFYILPFGDVHLGSHLCAKEEFWNFIKWEKDNPNVYYLGMGDYQDWASSSERALLARGLHETTMEDMEAIQRKRVVALSKEFGFMKGRLIGLIEGNHYAEFRNGTTSTQYLAQLLKADYLGVSGIVCIAIRFKKSTQRLSVNLWAHHGKGAARLLGGSLNAVQHMAEGAENIDIYLMGHDHRKIGGPGLKLVPTLDAQGKEVFLRERYRYYVRTGGFLRGYIDGKPSYVADGAKIPAGLGGVRISVTPHNCKLNGLYPRVEVTL